MKTGNVQRTPASVLKQNQQSTTQTKPSVVIHPPTRKDLGRKIFSAHQITSTLKTVKSSSKPSRGAPRRVGKAIQRSHPSQVIARSLSRSSILLSMFYIRVQFFPLLATSKITVQKPVCFLPLGSALLSIKFPAPMWVIKGDRVNTSINTKIGDATALVA